MSWTTERVELLKKLWGDGLSASQIAGELGGVTRNAVIGKVHRLGLSGRAKTTTTAPKTRRKKVAPAGTAGTSQHTAKPLTQGSAALKMESAPLAEAVPAAQAKPVADLVPISSRASILELTERTCKWPIGDPSKDDFYFCGRQSDVGVPYCAHHCKIAYQPVSDRRRDRRTNVRAAS
ncbi:GcrA cell cycle regulator [Roseibium aquae]|uniref:GcrA cell cycle regulator n=1 Tax=Roseibium aquae TaxID=1323746 RepID=A0A916TK37_9HYPH|nr:GcrA family cell cycle regulator [Roseibium aquae]GGB51312.1 GcrA cell cycle regulator [Roseibium aquae]